MESEYATVRENKEDRENIYKVDSKGKVLKVLLFIFHLNRISAQNSFNKLFFSVFPVKIISSF